MFPQILNNFQKSTSCNFHFCGLGWNRLRVRVQLQPIPGQFRFRYLPFRANSESSKNELQSVIESESGLEHCSPVITLDVFKMLKSNMLQYFKPPSNFLNIERAALKEQLRTWPTVYLNGILGFQKVNGIAVFLTDLHTWYLKKKKTNENLAS